GWREVVGGNAACAAGRTVGRVASWRRCDTPARGGRSSSPASPSARVARSPQRPTRQASSSLPSPHNQSRTVTASEMRNEELASGRYPGDDPREQRPSLALAEAAKACGVSASTIRRYLRAGRLPHPRPEPTPV